MDTLLFGTLSAVSLSIMVFLPVSVLSPRRICFRPSGTISLFVWIISDRIDSKFPSRCSMDPFSLKPFSLKDFSRKAEQELKRA
jgi:hypothetical protein